MEVVITWWNRSPYSMLQALRNDWELMKLMLELQNAGHEWQLSDPEGVKIFVAPHMYSAVLDSLRSEPFTGVYGDSMLLTHLKKWNIYRSLTYSLTHGVESIFKVRVLGLSDNPKMSGKVL